MYIFMDDHNRAEKVEGDDVKHAIFKLFVRIKWAKNSGVFECFDRNDSYYRSKIVQSIDNDLFLKCINGLSIEESLDLLKANTGIVISEIYSDCQLQYQKT